MRKHVWVSLVLVGSCSDGVERSGSLPLPGAADSLTGSSDEQPTLVLLCLDGRVDAYLVMGTSAEPGVEAHQRVSVQLDSAPPCAEPAP